jgi:hypothetical protein
MVQSPDGVEIADVVVVDLGGHGQSGLGRSDWNMQAFGDDVVAVVEEVGAQKVVLVGHARAHLYVLPLTLAGLLDGRSETADSLRLIVDDEQ